MQALKSLKFLRTPILKNICERLLLEKEDPQEFDKNKNISLRKYTFKVVPLGMAEAVKWDLNYQVAIEKITKGELLVTIYPLVSGEDAYSKEEICMS